MKKTALIVIDIQNDITKNYKDIINNINRAIDIAKVNKWHVVYIKHNDLTPSAKYFKPETKGAELVPDLNVISNNIFIKSKGNALTSKEFKSFIDANESTEFYITGADATECVKSTCYNMTKSGYIVHVISDGITSYNKAKIPEMIEYYSKKGCDIIKLNELKEI